MTTPPAAPLIIAMQSAAPVQLTAMLQSVALPDDGKVPDWIHLLPTGIVQTADARGPYTVKDCQQIIANSNAVSTRLPLDENHAIDIAAPAGEPSPARGWIVALEARDDGVWGKVEWTRPGRVLVAGKAYRHISPVIAHDRDKVVSHVLRASLVNRPNLVGLKALNSPEGTSMDLLTQIRQLLGLPETADDNAVLAALGSKTMMATCAADIAKLVGVDGKEATVVLNAVRERTDPAKMVPAAAVVALQQQLGDLTASMARGKAEAYVDGAIKAGKVGVKPLRDHFISRHMVDAASVEKEIGGLPAHPALQASGATSIKPGNGDAGALDADEAKIVALCGIDPEAFKKAKAGRLAREEAF